MPCSRELTNGHHPFTVKVSQLHGEDEDCWTFTKKYYLYMQYFLRKGGKISATVCGMQHVENATPINFEITNVREQKICE